MENKVWGWHLIINAKGCNVDRFEDDENIKAFVKELIEKIDMVAYKDTFVETFALDDPEKKGPSFFQMIETSHISGHFVSINGNAYVDVFSCKEYDHDVVLDLFEKYFYPDEILCEVIPRI